MKKLVIAGLAASLITLPAEAADTKDVIAGVIGGVFIGKALERREDHHHHGNSSTVVIVDGHTVVVPNPHHTHYTYRRRAHSHYEAYSNAFPCSSQWAGYQGCGKVAIEALKHKDCDHQH